MLSAVFMRDTTSNAAVAQWGCTAIYYIARGTCVVVFCVCFDESVRVELFVFAFINLCVC